MEKFFLAAHAAENRDNEVNKQRVVSFGTANTSVTVNRAPAYAATATASDVLSQIETYMENIAAAATTNHETLGVLVDSTDRLTQTNPQQHSIVYSLWDEIKELWAKGATGRSSGRADASVHTLSITQEKKVIQDLNRGWYIVFFAPYTDME